MVANFAARAMAVTILLHQPAAPARSFRFRWSPIPLLARRAGVTWLRAAAGGFAGFRRRHLRLAIANLLLDHLHLVRKELRLPELRGHGNRLLVPADRRSVVLDLLCYRAKFVEANQFEIRNRFEEDSRVSVKLSTIRTLSSKRRAFSGWRENPY